MKLIITAMKIEKICQACDGTSNIPSIIHSVAATTTQTANFTSGFSKIDIS
jgi:hypothetical protein